MTDLSGTWQGSFAYRMIYQDTPFTARIVCREGMVSGTITETRQTEFGFTPDRMEAEIAGTLEGRRVRFTKTYQPAVGLYRTIDYEGALSGDGGAISGTWRTALWSGTFSMQRSEG